jgi:hypothetical protein
MRQGGGTERKRDGKRRFPVPIIRCEETRWQLSGPRIVGADARGAGGEEDDCGHRNGGDQDAAKGNLN